MAINSNMGWGGGEKKTTHKNTVMKTDLSHLLTENTLRRESLHFVFKNPWMRWTYRAQCSGVKGFPSLILHGLISSKTSKQSSWPAKIRHTLRRQFSSWFTYNFLTSQIIDQLRLDKTKPSESAPSGVWTLPWWAAQCVGVKPWQSLIGWCGLVWSAADNIRDRISAWPQEAARWSAVQPRTSFIRTVALWESSAVTQSSHPSSAYKEERGLVRRTGASTKGWIIQYLTWFCIKHGQHEHHCSYTIA